MVLIGQAPGQPSPFAVKPASIGAVRSLRFDDLVQGYGNWRRIGRLGDNRRYRRLRCGRLLGDRRLRGTAAAVVTNHDGGRQAVSVQLLPVAGRGLLRRGGAKRQSSKHDDGFHG